MATHQAEMQSASSYDRLQELRDKLVSDALTLADFADPHRFHLSEKGKQFLQDVAQYNLKYSRGGKGGEGYVGVQDVIDMLAAEKDYPAYYNEESLAQLNSLSESVQQRMRVKISRQYAQHAMNIPANAKHPHPILKVVMPDSEEVKDMAGEADPSNQNRYSPMPGLLHKYEMLLAYVSINCSSHCRYCYRSDLFNGISQKSKADLPLIAAYIRTYNVLIEEAIETDGLFDPASGLVVHREHDEPLLPIREILFSGGDPLTLPNATIARYLALMAEAGIRTVRFGTKEMVFNPERFNDDFWAMMDAFHAAYPKMRVEIVGHYVHPFELVDAKTNDAGEYLYDINQDYTVRADFQAALDQINARRSWMGHFNQFPIIAGVNDSPDILRLLMYLTNRLGIILHNVYACREIIGNAHFRQENTIGAQYRLLEMAKAGLSGVENHGRLIMSTEFGKVEVMGVQDRKFMLRLNRFVHGSKPDRTMLTVDMNKISETARFYWLTNEIIDSPALSAKGKEVMRSLVSEDTSYIKKIKNKAAAIVRSNQPATDSAEQEQSEATVEVFSWEDSKTFHVDMRKERPNATIATVLAREGIVQAACGEKLSCSTCVGNIETDATLPAPSEDEMDLVDSALRLLPHGQNDAHNLRATCCLKLKGGQHYRFTPLDAPDLRVISSDENKPQLTTA